MYYGIKKKAQPMEKSIGCAFNPLSDRFQFLESGLFYFVRSIIILLLLSMNLVIASGESCSWLISARS